MLAEFSTVTDALTSATGIQQELADRNQLLSDQRKVEFRVGVNLGEVIVDRGDIYGDGVNVAARLESLAEPGGICISDAVRTSVGKKLDLHYEFMGEQVVKNISEPVRAYKVLLGSGEASERISPTAEKLELPDRPSIAVLPFTNMSGNPDQEYFADGMTDDLITDLSKNSGLFVIARNSTFAYKGESRDLRKVSGELGVRFILEGSVRRAGSQVRVNAQLIDATTGGHLWAERYDGLMTDVFALQDRVTQQIVTALAVTLTAVEDARQVHKQTENPEAYDAFLKGWTHYRQYTKKDFVKALDYFKRAVELDPNYARAHAAISGLYTFATVRYWHFGLGWHDAPSLAERHLELAMKYPVALTHRVASILRSQQGRHDEALAEADQMLALDRNDAENYDALGYALIWAGRPDEAIDAYNKAMRLDPHYPAQYLERLGIAYFNTGNFKAAVESLARARKRNPGLAAWTLAAAYGHLGRVEEATESLTRYQEYRGLSKLPAVDLVLGGHPYKRREDAQRLGGGLIKAGLCCPKKLDSYLETMQGDNRSFTRPDEGGRE